MENSRAKSIFCISKIFSQLLKAWVKYVKYGHYLLITQSWIGFMKLFMVLMKLDVTVQHVCEEDTFTAFSDTASQTSCLILQLPCWSDSLQSTSSSFLDHPAAGRACKTQYVTFPCGCFIQEYNRGALHACLLSNKLTYIFRIFNRFG